MIHRTRAYLKGFWYSLPIQLLLLHFRRYQIMLLFWLIMFATVNGSFMNTFGARILFLHPEYLNKVGFVSAMMVGIGISIFIMSWNITTFILHHHQIRFLATAAQPFLKYCINNAILPIIFLVYYLVKAVAYNHTQELLSFGDIAVLFTGFLSGFSLSLLIAFSYFFAADRTIYRYLPVKMKEALHQGKKHYTNYREVRHPKGVIRVDWFLSGRLALRRPRYIGHYPAEFIERIFKQHHLAAVFSIILAFVSLIVVGYYLDNPLFQIPAATSISVFFAILIAVAGALSYFLGSWSVFAFVAFFMVMDLLYKQDILDPRNKAYGLDYSKKQDYPTYSKEALQAMMKPEDIQSDSLRFIKTLEAWKSRQTEARPIMFVIATSGGGTRSASFTFDVLRCMDSLGGRALMPATTLISGASGGMMGALWYRELHRLESSGAITSRFEQRYNDAISADLLNAIFSSMVARDVLSPAWKFEYRQRRYNKDRGYAFEQELNSNTFGWLDKPLSDYYNEEADGRVPLAILNSVITRDGRKLMIGTSPMRFMMSHYLPDGHSKTADPDVVDFQTMFAKRQASELRLLSALRMNATFPYILPNVWLPSNPVVDVMDAGFRDNTGVETTLRFLSFFQEWIKANCSKVVLVQIRDKPEGGWRDPSQSSDLFELLTKPALLTQNNVIRFQEFHQWSLWDWLSREYGDQLERVLFEYAPSKPSAAASLSFHLTSREKRDIEASLNNDFNRTSFSYAVRLLKKPVADSTRMP